MNEVARRIEVLTGSLRCFVLGWCSLVPLLGLPFGAWAVVVFWKTRGRHTESPNPARAYLAGGLALGLMGVALSGVTTLIINLALYHAYLEGAF